MQRELNISALLARLALEVLGDVLVQLGARLRDIDEDIPFVPDAPTSRL